MAERGSWNIIDQTSSGREEGKERKETKATIPDRMHILIQRDVLI
jgi:hypothetical protein